LASLRNGYAPDLGLAFRPSTFFFAKTIWMREIACRLALPGSDVLQPSYAHSQGAHMNPLNDRAPHQAQLFSSHLGEMAASRPPTQPPFAPTSRLLAILSHFRERSRAKEHAMHKLRMNEFMAPE
jgi:hypothetical protein